MASLELEIEDVSSELYLALGLKGKRKGVPRTPRVLSIISSLLERSVQKNEKLLETGEKKDVITIFHGLRAPGLSIRQYIERIFKYSSCSPSCFVVAHIYMDRFLQRGNVHLTSLNVHRILITSVMVAAKFLDDAFFNNAYYAKVGGVTTAEMNRLEIKFLFSLDFRLQVTVDAFRRHCLHLEKEANGGYQIERQIQMCRLEEGWQNAEEATCTVNIQRVSCGTV
ncbi:hypothetical protein AQUCO_05400100v1 [Aquilegia coerulea]|uniref:Cyclin n=1 Tax=Aquilegia coerulea TaxID=218851 RepID=A0A2G5CHM7_AQUCA|nr:hypothetical protein AQUCO_05400100v1 [Aquilegia coerulea]PIA30763.1 hypothetical protein AQUCO_05400100v1 [Aquilegia coerulea]